jgi:cold shock CspA family protein
MLHGILAKINHDRGFAFTREGNSSYFLHATSVSADSPVTFSDAVIGDLVDFEGNTDDPKGLQAVRATITKRPAGQRQSGVVKTYNARGFGFVRAEDGHEYFCHATVCEEGFDLNSEAVGTEVTFELVEGGQGKLACLDVRRRNAVTPQL